MNAKQYLTKQRNGNADFCFLEVEDKFLHIKQGKIIDAKQVTKSSMTKNCGSKEKAFATLEAIIEEYKGKGFVKDATNIREFEIEVFDKAKWHINKDFPNDLDPHQAYIHTGFYIGWLITKNLFNYSMYSVESIDAISQFLNKKISSVAFYKDYMDGIFTAEDVQNEGVEFTKMYFNFEEGQYLQDYEDTLAGDVETLFHVQDTWENFAKISSVIEKRYDNWFNSIN